MNRKQFTFFRQADLVFFHAYHRNIGKRAPNNMLIARQLKEVLRRENQGLKVYPVDGSSVFNMTGTYF